MTIARATQFLSNSGPNGGADAATPQSRLLETLNTFKLIPLDDVAKVSGLTPDEAATAMTRLRQDGRAVVIERRDGGNRKYLSVR